ncbi:MAG: SUMF1/EgtB/PvdO family nonheme iron enzyme [Phycisphaerales bacterium]|nr:SUMF1/EgtB/PvdO family nonheme iron enzyme [Phycisphaerales bacterium]
MFQRWIAIFGLALLAASGPAMAAPPSYDFQWVTVGAPGNPAFPGPDRVNGLLTNRGSVSYEYRISKLEVTTTQWVEFANAIGRVRDPFRIGEGALGGFEGGPTGPNDTYSYSLQNFPNIGMYPVTGISWLNAARYCNWLHNGKVPTLVALENGAYDLRAYNADPSGDNARAITRLPGAQYWIPSIDEWIKAAHFDPNGYGPGQARWWLQPNKSDTPPVLGVSPLFGGNGTTSASLWPINPNAPLGSFLLGAYPDSVSPWGLLDTSGGAAELLDDQPRNSGSLNRYYEGSSVYFDVAKTGRLDGLDTVGGTDIASADDTIGLRIASAVPSPTGVVMIAGLCALHTIRRRR